MTICACLKQVNVSPFLLLKIDRDKQTHLLEYPVEPNVEVKTVAKQSKQK